MLSLRNPAAGRLVNRFLRFAALILGAVLISACSGGSLNNFFSGSGGSVSTNLAPVSFSNIIGPPKTVGDQLTAQLISEAKQKQIPVVTEKNRSAAYTVQGYLAQSNEPKSEKFSYILDVTDKSGKRVHRILGEEAVPAKPGAKPWGSINQAAIQKIASKTANDLATWLPTQSGSSASSSPPAAAPERRSAPPPSTRRSAPKPPPASTPAPTAERTSPPPKRTASTATRSRNIAALVTPVSGAPGDGRTSLTNAVKDKLRARGVQIASTGGSDVYRINGKVTMGPAPGSNQRVQIVWRLTSPTGRDLGTVTQQSEVAKGSLDRSWGQAAVSAGGAAAAEIIKLIEKNKS